MLQDISSRLSHGSSSLQALHLALREALPHLSQLEAVVVEVEEGDEDSTGW